MYNMKKLISIVLVCMMAFASVSAEAAKRMGGGKSVGQQSSNVSKKQAAPPAQATPPVAAPAPRAPWGAMLGGLAAGLGLAWLASSLGLGAAFGNILMALLIGVAVLAVIGWFMRKRMNTSNENNLAYQGNNAPSSNMFNPYNQPTRFSRGSMIGSALATTTWTIPAGFDIAGFESAAKQNFVLLQAAWDRADVATLGGMMTDVMLKEIQQQLADREVGPHRTAVVSLEAKLLGIEETDADYIASVEFTGVIQENVGAEAEAFEEVWNMTKSKSAGGWVLAGIQVN
jgi:predicted lipid-binding transport protein (Tim44 family)